MIYESVKNKIKDITIGTDETISNVLKKMDEKERKLLLIIKNNKFYGLVSIGDIQRALIKNANLKTPVKKIIRKNIQAATTEQKQSEIKRLMMKERIEFMPILDKNNNLADIYFWEEVILEGIRKSDNRADIPVCIMAGGRGERMKPLTNVIPKPLLPINEKPIIQEIIDKFAGYGTKTFYISVNYKAEVIKYFLKKSINNKIRLITKREKKPLGTAGSLNLFKNYLTKTFFVTNCDVIINQDFSEVYEYHKKEKNTITIITSLKNIDIPYGIVKTGKNGRVINITEKPNLSYYINTGMYILEPEAINIIPDNTFFHMTDLIEKTRKEKGKIGFYPVSEGSLKDIGNWKEYIKAIT